MQVVFMASNRFFVCLPQCRNPDDIALDVGFATDVVEIANKIKKICRERLYGRQRKDKPNNLIN
ncbi:hypothetical protein CPC08DRAFT_559556 [Agrocybe pediades]|nr:hypothetical protein CPC08DRAFT_559556 [Agrocybe pediades]